MRSVDCREDVVGVSGGGDSNQYVAIPAQTLDLPTKHLVVATTRCLVGKSRVCAGMATY